jgi:hypothetical protein
MSKRGEGTDEPDRLDDERLKVLIPRKYAAVRTILTVAGGRKRPTKAQNGGISGVRVELAACRRSCAAALCTD